MRHSRSNDQATARFRRAGGTIAAACLVVATVAVAGVVLPAGGEPAPPATLEAVVSSADGAQRVVSTDLAVTPIEAADPAQVTVDPDAPRQYLYGTGAALTDASAHLLSQLSPGARDAALRALFDPAQGGLSVVRLVIGPSDFSRTLASLDDSTEPDPTLAKFSIAHDLTEIIPVARQIMAINPDVTFIASSWSAPAWMKNPNNILYGVLRPEYEEVYADYLVRFLTAYRAEGVPVSRISIQNEPAAFKLDAPTMTMDTAQQIRVTEALGPKLAAAGLDTRVLVWDHNWCTATPPGGCTGPAPPQAALDILDATAGKYPVAGTALHCYGGDHRAANEGMHAAWPDLEVWQTECSGGDWNGTRAQAFTGQATLVLRDYAYWASASLYWNLALDPAHGPHTGGCTDCRGVLTIDPATGAWEPNVELDVQATISRFAPAGSGVLTTTMSGAPRGLEAVSVCSPDRRAAVILWNPQGATTVTVRFGDQGFAVPVGAGTLTSVRAPEGIECTLADQAPIDPAPTTSTTSTSTSTTNSSTSTVPSSSVPPSTLPVPTGPDSTTTPTSPTAAPVVAGSGATPDAPPALPIVESPAYTG